MCDKAVLTKKHIESSAASSSHCLLIQLMTLDNAQHKDSAVISCFSVVFLSVVTVVLISVTFCNLKMKCNHLKDVYFR